MEKGSHITCVESLRLYIDGFQSVNECLGKGGGARDNALTNSKYCTIDDKTHASGFTCCTPHAVYSLHIIWTAVLEVLVKGTLESIRLH
jgi:hypothetical protein